MNRLKLDKEFGGDTAGTADINWPKGLSIPYKVMQNNKRLVFSCVFQGSRWSEAVRAQVCLLEVLSGCHCITCLVFSQGCGFFFLLFHVLNCPYLDP